MPAFGLVNETGTLRRVLAKRPQEVFQTQFLIDTNWEKAGWSSAPEYNAAAEEHFRFIRFLQNHKIAINYHDDDWIISLDSIALRDTCVMTPAGLVQGNLHEPPRIPESESIAGYVTQLGAEELGAIEAPDKLSGSDFVWIRPDLVLTAETPRTTAGAIAQFKHICEPHMKSLQVVTLKLRSSDSENQERQVRTALRNALSPLSESVLLIAKHRFEQESIDLLEKDLGLTLEDVSEEEYSLLGASLLIVNATTAAGPDCPELLPLYERLTEKYKIRTYRMTYEHLGRSGMGLGSLILTLLRDA
eukprot:Protomagalhaensia_wolfi_Nauph_80__1123@NODE_165_length_3359_cov_142_432831_g124_i0_p2_GENE_NODE_165_length_3359_cov_142_432831_g124_i0NODE_165_length_3359_cov_142_432831_g124_i0_p2_ORF_typecomplete_len303_score38_57Amidinotransf/PF02274_17/1_3e09_NODE_165_length_3359_cov_142_432831_g124_i07971705